MSKSHYAVRRGRKTGVFSTWAETYAAVNGFTGAQHRKFGTRADADLWLSGVEVSKPAPPSKRGARARAARLRRGTEETEA